VIQIVAIYNFSPSWSLFQSPLVITFVARSVTSPVKIYAFIYLSQVLGSPHETLHFVFSRFARRYGTYFHGESKHPILYLDYLYERLFHLTEPSPILHPNYLGDQIYDKFYNELYDVFRDRPPCPSDFFTKTLLLVYTRCAPR
jgi:hypothetical protein